MAGITRGRHSRRFVPPRGCAGAYLGRHGVLGHSQIAVTANTYAHVRVEATRVAVEAVDALLTG